MVVGDADRQTPGQLILYAIDRPVEYLRPRILRFFQYYTDLSPNGSAVAVRRLWFEYLQHVSVPCTIVLC